MATSQWGAVVQALAQAAAATPGFRLKGDQAPGETTCTVYRGPEPLGTLDPSDWLAIGWAGDGLSAGSWDQRVGPLNRSARPRDETGVVACVVHVETGNPDPVDALTRAEAIVAAVETVLRADPTLGLVPPLQRLVAEVRGAGDVAWASGKRGHTCEIGFVVGYSARI